MLSLPKFSSPRSSITHTGTKVKTSSSIYSTMGATRTQTRSHGNVPIVNRPKKTKMAKPDYELIGVQDMLQSLRYRDRIDRRANGQRKEYNSYRERYQEGLSETIDFNDCEKLGDKPFSIKHIEDTTPRYECKEFEISGGLVVQSGIALKQGCHPLFKGLDDEGKYVAVERERVPAEQIQQRLDEFGRLGKAFYNVLLRSGITNRCKGIISQRSEIEELGNTSAVLAAGYSLIYADLPIQVGGNNELLAWMATNAYDIDTIVKERTKLKNSGAVEEIEPLDLEKESIYKYFKPKKNKSVENKTNVYFSEIVTSVQRIDKNALSDYKEWSYRMKGMYNDQASASLMYFMALRNDVKHAALISIEAVQQPKEAGGLSTAIKSLGMQWRLLGAMLVEGGSLQGRGVGEIDIRAVMLERTKQEAIESMVLDVNQQQLYEKVVQVLDDEMNMEQYKYEEPRSFWSRRWEWGVNGAHSRLLQNNEPQWKVEPEKLKRLHRRVYLEEVHDSPMDKWSGIVYVSCIKKIENEKERDLQSIDSNTYIAFQHLIEGVERCWKGKKVLLDPGKGGTTRMAERIRAIQGKRASSQNVMIDYAKYNTQHSLESQKTVMKALCDKIGYPTGMSEKIINSFDKMELYVDGEHIGRAKGTLLSGHRLTTFINSVLNLAYLKVFCPIIDNCMSMHVGDDVFVSAPDLKTAGTLVMQLKLSPIRAKQAKQSLGEWSAEFLRMCTRGKVTRGYLCRTISTCIMGNWVNDLRLEPEEALKTMIDAGWTLANRSQNLELSRLLYCSVCRMTGMKGWVVDSLLMGQIALNDGPQRAFNGHRCYVRIKGVIHKGVKKKDKYRAQATRDFLENHMSDLEVDVLDRNNINVFGAMKDASYSKSDKDVSNISEYTTPCIQYSIEQRGIYSHERLEKVLYRERAPGALSKYTILNMVKNQLDGDELALILRSDGVDLSGNESEEELYMLAWGTKYQGCVISGWLPYADAAALGALTSSHNLDIDDYVFVFA
jgi:hypothetical protein